MDFFFSFSNLGNHFVVFTICLFLPIFFCKNSIAKFGLLEVKVMFGGRGSVYRFKFQKQKENIIF